MTENVITFPFRKSTPNSSSHQSEIVALLLRYVDLARRVKISSIAIMTTAKDWRHGLEMLTEDEDASDLATTMKIARQRCLRRIGD